MADGKQDELAVFFDTCAKLEELCAQLYHFYSDIHQADAELSKLWEKTALEEENHRKQFELASRLLTEDCFELAADLKKTKRICQKLVGFLDSARRNPPDPVSALKNAVNMEEQLHDLHMHSAVHFKDVSIKNLFVALKEFDSEHIRTLRTYLVVLELPYAVMRG